MKGTVLVMVAVSAACGGAKPTLAPSPRPAASQSSVVVTDPAPTPADDETVLVSRPSKIGRYFSDLKRRVASRWNPIRAWNALPEALRTSLGTATRKTVLEVELFTDGRIEKYEMREASGVSELDVEAVRALQDASPFGAPPDRVQAKPFNLGFVFDPATSSTTIEP